MYLHARIIWNKQNKDRGLVLDAFLIALLVQNHMRLASVLTRSCRLRLRLLHARIVTRLQRLFVLVNAAGACP